jgi:hypothetical protein
MTSPPVPWTTPADVASRLRRKWEAGAFLSAYATGEPFDPVAVPIRGPKPGELATRLDQVRDWARNWSRAESMRVEYKKIGGRLFGANELPGRAWIDDYETLWRLLKVTRQVARFRELLAASDGPVADWARAHPMKVLGLEGDWERICATVRWIAQHDRSALYLRQVDVPGVDTKFIEKHRGVLAELLDGLGLATDAPRAQFALRYGFRGKPPYVRFRLPGRDLAGFSELTVRADEVHHVPPGVTTVYVVENEITYLAFPLTAGRMVIFGSGYAVGRLERLPWLDDVRLVYWGDIDTHGFAILDGLRRRFPQTTSMLMDRETLLGHAGHWATEHDPKTGYLDRLTTPERELYHDLIEDRLGEAVRLEQERIRFSALERALHR